MNLAHRAHYEQFTQIVAVAEALDDDATFPAECAALFARLSETAIRFEPNAQADVEAFLLVHHDVMGRLLDRS